MGCYTVQKLTGSRRLVLAERQFDSDLGVPRSSDTNAHGLRGTPCSPAFLAGVRHD